MLYAVSGSYLTPGTSYYYIGRATKIRVGADINNNDTKKLNSISARVNYFALLVSIASIIGAIAYLVLIQQHTQQDARHEVDSRGRVLTNVVGEQVQFYRRIFQRLSERPEVGDLLFLQNESSAAEWAKNQNRLLPDSVGMALITRDGKVLGNPAEHYIGKECLTEMGKRLQGEKLPGPPIHEGIPKYAHFDLTTLIRDADGQSLGMLFASISTSAVKQAMSKIVRDGEVVEISDAHGHTFVSAGGEDILKNPVTLVRPIPHTNWAMKISFNVPPAPAFYYWISASIIFAAILFSGTVIYLIRSLSNGLIGEMNSVHYGLKKIITGTFSGFLPRPRYQETAEVLPAIEELSNLIYKRNQNLTQISETDELTKLFNRRRIMHELKRTVSQATRELKAIVVLLDLDDFKPINDEYGHDVGDRVLVAFADALLETRRGSDVVGRLGGDEFIAILIEPGEDAEAWYKRLNHRYAAVLDQLGSPLSSHKSTISAGAALLNKTSASTVESVLKKADTALYQAKKNGRAQLVTI